MKIPFKNYELRYTRTGRRERAAAHRDRQSSIVNRKSQGIALVITLIMLSVITFMAIAFLVLSRRDRGGVSTTTDLNTARFAADSAFERAKAEMIAPILAMTNDQQFDLLVSTNFINRNGFFNGVSSPTNVNYDFRADGLPYTSDNFLQNLTNLFFNPRPPVFVPTNVAFANDFRFYVDLNRNSRYDTNGYLPVRSPDPLNPYYTTNNVGDLVTVPANYAGWILSNNFVGDPEWIGVLEFPDRPHGPNNRFLARYAYIVLPIAKTLDVNFMHNQAVTRALNSGNDGYLRNQGVGTWELNLAAFLTDLNTNQWDPTVNPYMYRQAGLPSLNNRGLAFEDSLALLAYRYNQSYQTLSSASQLFPGGAALFTTDGIDEYSDGFTMTGTTISESALPDQVGEKWAGSDNTNRFFTTQDFFNRSKIFPATGGFVDRLQNAGTSNDTYNAYTFYRMLAQLGTDSEPDDRINVNYRNVSNNIVVPGMETNLYAWQPLEFFTNAAQAMFKQLNLRDINGNLISITNIPLYPTNYYTPSVHRILQLAANIYDATTRQSVPLAPGQTNAFVPSVFRPIFSSYTVNGVKWAAISGYVEETSATGGTSGLSYPYADIGNFANNNSVNPRTDLNLWGVPWVVGAKKGFPNFNYNAAKPSVSLTRKIQLSRAKTGDPLTVKQMFSIGISNEAVVEAWNSYASDWPTARPLIVQATNEFIVHVVNTTNVPAIDLVTPDVRYFSTVFLTNTWGHFNSNYPTRSMLFLIQTNYPILGGPTAYAYYSGIPAFRQGTNFENTFQLIPQWYVIVTNRLHYALIDQALNRVVDYVNVDMSQTYDLTYAITNGARSPLPYSWDTVWNTRLFDSSTTPFVPWSALAPGTVLTEGIDSQIEISLGANTGVYQPTNSAAMNNWIKSRTKPAGTNQLEYNPTFGTNLISCLQANDPLVHYTVPDLTDQQQDPAKVTLLPQDVNHHYQPWGGRPGRQEPDTDYDWRLKDSLAVSSDSWDFPTNKLPNVGWLGRVHRGTPWQTVYAKAAAGDSTNFTSWLKWSGHTNLWGNTSDAVFSMPINDRSLFDLFTAAPNDNASRGRLNVNQTNLAAWSAVLSGVTVITNVSGTNVGWTIIDPAGIYSPTSPPPLVQIWTNINATRANLYFSNGPVFADQSFHNIGDVLAAPALTTQSPFLANAVPLPPNPPNNTIQVNDEVVERIPQQIMSLLSLSHEPRFVVYSFGQTLHPAEHSLVTGGQLNGLCTNYQITAETATRAVVRAVPFSVTNGNIISTNYNLMVEQYNVLPPD